MDYLLQCLRLNGELISWCKFEEGEMDVTERWNNSEMQKIYFNFRISDQQRKRLIELLEMYTITFNAALIKDNELYRNFAIELTHNNIVDIRYIDMWEDMIIKEEL